VKLSPHFTSEEFDCHDGTPVPTHAHLDLISLCRLYLEPLRVRFGPVTIVSGYRTLTYNARVGGAPLSYHVYKSDRWGVAADVRCRRGTPREWHAYLEELDVGGLGAYKDHVHVDNRDHRGRW
jgi:uncharacterized protein YcbK (DUF882 family)